MHDTKVDTAVAEAGAESGRNRGTDPTTAVSAKPGTQRTASSCATPVAQRLRLDDQLCFALYAATHAVTRAYQPLLKSINLTYPQYLVMLVLWQDGKSTIGAIARRLDLAPHALTPLLDRLEANSFVKRTRGRSDRRVIHVSLTVSGAELEESAALAQRQVQCQTALDEPSLAALRTCLHELVETMASGPGE